MSPTGYFLYSTKLLPLILYGKTLNFFNKFFSIYNYLFRFFCLFGFQWTFWGSYPLVGPSGLEPPTSCLSGTRSNLLSYEPMWLVWCFHTWVFEVFLPHGGDDGDSMEVCICKRSSVSQAILNRGSHPIIPSFCRSLMLGEKIFLMVEMMGFEPMTPCLQGRCSPSWATPPNRFGRRMENLFSLVSSVKKEAWTSFLPKMSALSYLPVQSPVKYCHHCRA